VLGIPFYVWDLSDRFADEVVSDFLAEYAAGHTPNPCLRCNEKIKFSAVLDRGVALGFDTVCTGHYGRLIRIGNDVELHRAADPAKDQSYVLGVLDQDQLRRSYFPLGSSLKAEVRAEAHDRGLAVADKPDSHDICFIANGDTAGFLEQRLGKRPGDIVDLAGAKVGEHAGSHRFTVGQRRGLRLGIPADDGKPRFVLSITPTTNTITVGPRDCLAVKIISAIRPTWTGAPPVEKWSGQVQVRAHGNPMEATVEVHDHGLEVELETTTTGVAPWTGCGSLRGVASCWKRDHIGYPSVTTSPDSELPPIRTTGIGSWPGTDMMDAIKIAFAECPDLPYLPELPHAGRTRT
jgi:tRNA-specific 2-thiouridylase